MKISENIYMIGSGAYKLSQDFDCNIYLVDLKDQLVMIDSGAGVDPGRIVKNIQKEGLDPEKISKMLLTHSHADHAGGCNYFYSKYGIEIYISEIESDFLEMGGEKEISLDIAKASNLYSPDYNFINCPVSKKIKDGQNIKLGDYLVKAIHTPGHSKGSFSYLFDLPEGRVLFSGDTVFAEGIILVLNIDGSEYSDYRKYLKKLSGQRIDILMPGHSIFVLQNGQDHIDKAIEGLKLLFLPENFM